MDKTIKNEHAWAQMSNTVGEWRGITQNWGAIAHCCPSSLRGTATAVISIYVRSPRCCKVMALISHIYYLFTAFQQPRIKTVH